MRLLPIASLLPLAAPAAGQELYAVTTDQLLRIDSSDPSVVEPVGALQLPPGMRIGALAYHPNDETFYTIGLEQITLTNRDYSLVAVDPSTGQATVRGLIMNSAAAGHVESIEYVPPLDALVISHTDGGQTDFRSDQYATVDLTSGAVTPLTASVLDTDTSTWDSGRDAYISLDPNGSDWASVDLTTGAFTPGGPCIDTIGDLAYEAATDRIFAIDFLTNRTIRTFPVAGGTPAIGPSTVLGDVPQTELRGIAFAPAPNQVGTSECGPAAPNSTGSSAIVRAYGSTTVADNELRLTASVLPPNQFTLLAVSRDAGSAVPPGSQGTLCLGGTIGRYNGSVTGSASFGSVSIPVDLTQVPQASTLAAVQPGETWRFQFWYRDVNPAQTSNFTDAVAITFQ